MTVIHEFTAPLWVQTPLGEGRALVLIDYGIDHNPVLFVHLDNGQFKCVDSNDCRGMENLMLGIKKPEAPGKLSEEALRALMRYPAADLKPHQQCGHV